MAEVPLWMFDLGSGEPITRSEVKVKVTQKWYATLSQPNMHSHTKFRITTSKIIEICTILNADSRNYVRGQGHSDITMVRRTSSTHTNFGIPTSNNIRDQKLQESIYFNSS